ncbi:pyridoxal-dependent decarboxylase [Actinoplanes sp. SE50]|uniref:pyridoxal phosphate-dependent decarboxylase family protein n=1 Tax=unclassified Actinoplanes TaxID=2626549 RepID=UPI00023ED508|nr:MULTISPECIES: aspartate aminotransferase family protein [unclassified Actinoplanes]AEV87879.1 pyridoxal-dependent decarboxylase [Actinoplanes sp. SE50/110]ATO86283.1 pyridoxal-dependent decarboxylase [Actinoplanes sp. SE50]SLM03698.1 cytochrome c biogenesis protein CcmH [Actinoplanes sp. SE50/110]
MEPVLPHLFSGSTLDAYTSAVWHASALLADRVKAVRQPYAGATVAELREQVDAVDLDRPLGDTGAALHEVARLYLDNAVWFHEPTYVAHLNCPVVIPALSAEVLLSAVNSSVDTWDQSTTATLIERRLVDWTAGRIGFGPDADGVFTSGGTQSNLQGLLLAREHALERRDRAEALPRLRIFATAQSHFSVIKSAGILGLAGDAVVGVATDGDGRMDAAALAVAIDDVRRAGGIPMAVVATAGTTDLGRIDPLPAIAAVCGHQRIWLHVDAAYGCGLLVSRRRRHLLDGVERADSVTVDFHKSFFQPVSCSALVVRRGESLSRIAVHADYLNPRAATVPNQVDKSLQTTRRFDALKLWMTLRTIGADRIGDMFDTVVDRTHEIFAAMRTRSGFETLAAPTLSTLLFRFRPAGMSVAECDELMPRLRQRLFHDGAAIVAGTTVDGHHWLKFTVLNPATTAGHLHDTLDLIEAAAVLHGPAVPA